jgi:hypothetical protein
VAKENSRGLFNAAADAERQQEKSERERREQFEELNILQTRGSELYRAIVGHLWVRNHLSEGMRITALHHTEMVEDLTVLQVMVSSAAEFTLGCSPNETI